MLFPTIDFALFFAFSFALVWGLNSYNTLKKVVLLALSLAFYASWNWRFLLLLLASGAISYFVGLYVDAGARRPFRRLALGLGVALDLGILAYFKYLDFFIAQVLTLAHALGLNPSIDFVNVTLPVAISFLTFHAISYVVDVYRGRLAPSRSPLDIVLYISFFPHLVAGPIVRAHEFLPQLASPRRAGDFSFGENMLLILGGLFKKMVIANYLAVRFVDPVFTDPSQFSRFDLIVAVYAYAIQIYADFSAYTDIAIGVAALLGYRFPQNFNQPYRALGIGDFWRRWHMTLSNWLRDYLYIPLGGNRHGALATARNLMLTMLLGRPLARRQLDVPDLGRDARRRARRRPRLAAQRRLRPLRRRSDRPRRRLGGDVSFRLLRLAVFPRALARRGDAVSGGRVERQRRAEHHADGRSAAHRLRRADANRARRRRAARSAPCSTIAARCYRPPSASRCSMRSSSWRPSASAPFIYFQF